MSLVVDRRSKVNGAGTHALICGIDWYPYLDPGGARAQPIYPGLPDAARLTAPVRTAKAILEWLVGKYQNASAPLSTCRVLLSPGPGRDKANVLAKSVAATAENLLRAAAEWRRDAGAHRDSVTLFYIAGHGFSLGPSEDVVMMHDFGDGVGSDLRNAIDVAYLPNGMAPTERNPDMARTQLYFIDSGRTRVAGLAEILGSRPTPVFDAALPVQDDRAALVFHASADNALAFGRVGGLTLFGEALLASLGGKGATHRDGQWVVTTVSLMEAMRDELALSGASSGVNQTLSIRGQTKDVIVTMLPKVPPAELAIAGLKSDDSHVRLSDSSFAQVHEWSAPFTSPRATGLKPGIYVVEIESDSGKRRQSILTLPPGRRTTVLL
jgi:hypothetical protein